MRDRIWRHFVDGPPEPPALAAWLTLALILVASLAVMVGRALAKTFWLDEVLTIYVGDIRPLGVLWQALLDGADGMPPAFHVVSRWAGSLPVDPHIAYRLPEMAGYLLAIAAVFVFVRRGSGRAAGLCASLLLPVTAAAYYAIEARPYALILGLLAAAAVCWQRLECHWGYALGFTAALVSGVSLHGLAPVAVACFVFAEVAESFAAQRIRRLAWVAFLCAAIPAVLTLPLLLGMRERAGGHFWARPGVRSLPDYYGDLLGTSLDATLVLLPLLLLLLVRAIALGWRRPEMSEDRRRALFLSASLLLLPAFLLAFMLATSGGYTSRYGLPAVLGFAFAVPVLLDWQGSRVPRFFVACLLVAFLVRSGVDLAVTNHLRRAVVEGRESPPLQVLRRWPAPPVPLVVTRIHLFLPSAYYASAAESRQLYLLTGLKPGRIDSTQEWRAIMQAHGPEHVQRLEDFLLHNSRFLVLGSESAEFDSLRWLLPALRQRGLQVMPLDAGGLSGQLFLVSPPQSR